jgi:hypothetical protein
VAAASYLATVVRRDADGFGAAFAVIAGALAWVTVVIWTLQTVRDRPRR